MASFGNTIKTTIAVGVDGAGSLKSLRQQIADADGATGKLKASFGGAGDFIKANAAAVAASAGAALIGFATKSVMAFQDLGLEAGKMADQLGITTEEASRLIEVAGDLGVSTEAVTKSMLFMEKTAGNSPATFQKLGVAIVKTAGGATDANATFLATIDRLKAIKDPTERTAAGMKLLGKGSAELAELMNGDLRTALANVSDAKVIDPDEVAKARALRESMDSLKDSFEDVALIVGEKLAPAVADGAAAFSKWGGAISPVVDAIGYMADAINPLDNIMKGWHDTVDSGTSTVDRFRGAVGFLAGSLPIVGDGLQDWISGNRDSGQAVDDHAEYVTQLTTYLGTLEDAAANVTVATDDEAMAQIRAAAALDVASASANLLSTAYAKLRGELSTERGYVQLQQTLSDLKTKGEEAFKAYKDGADDAEEKARAFALASLAAQDQTLAWLDSLGDIPTSIATDITSAIAEGDYDKVLQALEFLEKDRHVKVIVQETRPVGGLGGYRPGGSTTNTGSGAYGGPIPDMSGFQPMMSGVTNAYGLSGRGGGGQAFTPLPTVTANQGPFSSDILGQVEAFQASKDALDGANKSWTDQLKRYKDAERAATAGAISQEDWADAQQDATKSMIGAARAATDYATKQAALEGKTLSANEQAALQQQNLRSFQALVEPGSALFTSLDSYISLLDRVKTGTEDNSAATKDAQKVIEDRTKAALNQADADLAANRATKSVTDATNDYVGALFQKAKTAEEVAQRNDAITSSEQGLIDAILREADALAEQARNSAAASGTKLTDAQVAALKAQVLQSESSKLGAGNVKSAIDAYANTLTFNLTVNAGLGTDANLVGNQIYDALDRAMRQRGFTNGLAGLR